MERVERDRKNFDRLKAYMERLRDQETEPGRPAPHHQRERAAGLLARIMARQLEVSDEPGLPDYKELPRLDDLMDWKSPRFDSEDRTDWLDRILEAYEERVMERRRKGMSGPTIGL